MKQVYDCRIVLVRPRNPLNIGAAARAMANFGFRDLMVVEPHEPVWKEAKSAVGAEAVLASARAVATLAEAVADRTLVAGATSGRRRALATSFGGEFLPLSDLPGRASAARKVALLFGPEKTGLTNEHLSFCHLLVRISTTAECPSMNLAQAVAVCCYELSRAPAPPRTRKRPKPASMWEIEKLRAEMEAVLGGAGYYPSPARPIDSLKLRRLLLRLNPDSRHVAALRGMVAQLRWKLGQ